MVVFPGFPMSFGGSTGQMKGSPCVCRHVPHGMDELSFSDRDTGALEFSFRDRTVPLGRAGKSLGPSALPRRSIETP
jgi:hypothetical protein